MQFKSFWSIMFGRFPLSIGNDVKSVISGKTDAFITFMLDKINLTLDRVLQQLSQTDAYLSAEVQRLLDTIKYDIPLFWHAADSQTRFEVPGQFQEALSASCT